MTGTPLSTYVLMHGGVSMCVSRFMLTMHKLWEKTKSPIVTLKSVNQIIFNSLEVPFTMESSKFCAFYPHVPQLWNITTPEFHQLMHSSCWRHRSEEDGGLKILAASPVALFPLLSSPASNNKLIKLRAN